MLNMSAYKVWDIDTKARRDVPFAFTFIHEGFYPFKNKNDWPQDADTLPLKFYPTRESILDRREWESFNFDRSEEEEVLERPEILLITIDEERPAVPKELMKALEKVKEKAKLS